ncbi:uncharacterized protein LOC144164882 [Haemaphysalis longicornis]
MSSSKELSLKPFFAGKTHKENHPFRTIIEDKNTWQNKVAAVLQRHLNLLPRYDPFLISNSEEVVEFSKEHQRIEGTSVDVIDLFYSVPQQGLLDAVESAIDRNGAVKFMNNAGVRAADFLGLIKMYLHSLIIEFQGELFSQRDGICIGSRIAPVLCNLFLSEGDRALQEAFHDMGVIKGFRYVDDFLVFTEIGRCTRDNALNILEKFKEAHEGLDFTFEQPRETCLQYLDLSIKFGNSSPFLVVFGVHVPGNWRHVEAMQQILWERCWDLVLHLLSSEAESS